MGILNTIMYKKIILIVISLLILGGSIVGMWYFSNFQKYAPTTYVTDSNEGPVTIDTASGTKSSIIPYYTMVNIATHKDISSCYTVISGSVYDITLWVNMHPGGKGAILSLCGVDGTEKFMNKHKSGTKYMSILVRYKIGLLK